MSRHRHTGQSPSTPHGLLVPLRFPPTHVQGLPLHRPIHSDPSDPYDIRALAWSPLRAVSSIPALPANECCHAAHSTSSRRSPAFQHTSSRVELTPHCLVGLQPSGTRVHVSSRLLTVPSISTLPPYGLLRCSVRSASLVPRLHLTARCLMRRDCLQFKKIDIRFANRLALVHPFAVANPSVRRL
jgi:hypothetical protein